MTSIRSELATSKIRRKSEDKDGKLLKGLANDLILEIFLYSLYSLTAKPTLLLFKIVEKAIKIKYFHQIEKKFMPLTNIKYEAELVLQELFE